MEYGSEHTKIYVSKKLMLSKLVLDKVFWFILHSKSTVCIVKQKLGPGPLLDTVGAHDHPLVSRVIQAIIVVSQLSTNYQYMLKI